MNQKIRPALPRDLQVINDIYNHYVTRSTCTYQEVPTTAGERKRWFAHHGKAHPVIVAERDGTVIGWGSLSSFHPREAYRFTVEDSVYVHHAFHGQGIGKELLRELVEHARALRHRSIIAIISADQAASIALHAGAGFKEAGLLRRVGYKFDRWLDVVYMQRTLRRLPRR